MKEREERGRRKESLSMLCENGSYKKVTHELKKEEKIALCSQNHNPGSPLSLQPPDPW